ncbi:MAG: 50S ribosomal protein L11 methyltransferase [Anaerolineae bacterium]
MKWLEISVTTDGETAEAVVELFNRYGRGQSVVERLVDCFEYELADASPPATVVVKTYLPLDGSVETTRRRIEEGLWHLSHIQPIPEPAFRELSEQDWSEAWKQQYHRLHVGRRIVIVPAWEDYTPVPEEAVVKLEPGMAFGTGLHPTTRLCLEAMEEDLAAGCTVLDVGTGSGILAIAAAKLGAGSVLALDADPVAVRVARENVAANGVAVSVAVQHGSLPGGDVVPMHFSPEGPLHLLASGHYDLVLVNILAPVIAGMAPALAARLHRQGRLIAAGLIEEQERDVIIAFRDQGLTVVRRAQEEDWVCLVVQKE